MAKAKKAAGSQKSKSGSTKSKAPDANDVLVAESAARSLLARKQGELSITQHGESAAFKQMKQSLDKSHLQGVNKVLGAPLHTNTQHVGHKPGGPAVRNQTFGADVNRAGIPRRTNG